MFILDPSNPGFTTVTLNLCPVGSSIGREKVDVDTEDLREISGTSRKGQGVTEVSNGDIIGTFS